MDTSTDLIKNMPEHHSTRLILEDFVAIVPCNLGQENHAAVNIFTLLTGRKS